MDYAVPYPQAPDSEYILKDTIPLQPGFRHEDLRWILSIAHNALLELVQERVDPTAPKSDSEKISSCRAIHCDKYGRYMLA